MAFLQKTWKDRVAEYINRRVLTKEDGTTELVSVERSEGTISQEGDAFSAANMNDLEQRIADEFSEQNKNLGGFTPVIDEETGEITGYTTTIGGADTVFPFISNMSKLFSNYSFNSTNNVLNFNISAYSKIKYTCTSKVSTADINPFGVAKTVNGAGGSYMRLGEATGTYEVDVSAYKYLFIDVGYKSFPKFSEFRLIE